MLIEKAKQINKKTNELLSSTDPSNVLQFECYSLAYELLAFTNKICYLALDNKIDYRNIQEALKIDQICELFNKLSYAKLEPIDLKEFASNTKEWIKNWPTNDPSQRNKAREEITVASLRKFLTTETVKALGNSDKTNKLVLLNAEIEKALLLKEKNENS